MSDRFLFDGVYLAGNDLSIDEEVQLATNILSYAAQTNLVFRDVAVSGAGSALHSILWKSFAENRFLAQIFPISRVLMKYKSYNVETTRSICARSQARMN